MIDRLPQEIKNDIMSRLDTIGVSGNMLAATCRDLRQVALNPWTIAMWFMRWYHNNNDGEGVAWSFQRQVEQVFTAGREDLRYWTMEIDVLTLLVTHHLDGSFRIAYAHLLCWVAASRESKLLHMLVQHDILCLATEHAPALLLAAENDDTNTMTVLLDHGTAARGVSDDDMPMQVAAEAGSEAAVKLLLHRLGSRVLLPITSWVPPPLLLASGTTRVSCGRHMVMMCLLDAHVARAAEMGAPLRTHEQQPEAQPWASDAWRRSWIMSDGHDVLHKALGIVASTGPFHGGKGDGFFVRRILDTMRMRGSDDVAGVALSDAGRVSPDIVVECLLDACAVRECQLDCDDTATVLLAELRGIDALVRTSHMTGVWYERALLVACRAHRMRFVTVLLTAYEEDLPEEARPMSTTEAFERSHTDVKWHMRCDTIAAVAQHCRDADDGDVSLMSRLLARCVNHEVDALLQWPARALHLALHDALVVSCRRCDAKNATVLLPCIQAFGTINDVLLATALRIVVSHATAACSRLDEQRRCRAMAIFLMLVAAGGEADYMASGDDDVDGPLAHREHSPLTILSIAVSRNNEFVTRCLLDNGADPLASDAQAVVIALSEGNLGLSRMLLKRADDTIVEADEETRLMLRPAVQAVYNASRHLRDAGIMQAVAMMHRRLDAPLTTSSLAPHQ